MGAANTEGHREALVDALQTLLNGIAKVIAPLGGCTLSLLTPLTVQISVQSTNDRNGQQQERHHNHHCSRELALNVDGAGGLEDIRDAVIFQRHQRFGLRSAEASFKGGGVFRAQVLNMLAKVESFVGFIHTFIFKT